MDLKLQEYGHLMIIFLANDRPYVDANTVTHTRFDVAEIQPNIALPGPSQYANIEQQYDNNQVAIESPAPSTSTGTIDTDKNILMSPEAIRPFPKAPPRKNNTTRNRKGKTRVLTDTPEKEELELLAAKKRKKEVNKKKTNLSRSVFLRKKLREKVVVLRMKLMLS
ncbi:unnamed protein product [Parnassius apollo]|uniref:(apollo) hypothetical protein n=1 Tax=Parnassius apollo TaxID=110799 RepID=A0A8S3Y3U0_PARAO|nr:unnamed protein product [Parnassius apollo]